MSKKDDDKQELDNNLPAVNPSDDDNSSPKKKKNIFVRMWKSWCDWWKLTFQSYWVEVEDRILMSWKRIFKFLGVTIIPILYGVICSVAMWNPVESLGKAQTYVMDNDYSVLLVTDSNASAITNGQGSAQFAFGAVTVFNNSASSTNDILLGTGNGFQKTGLTQNDIIIDQAQGAIGIRNSAIKNSLASDQIAAAIFNNALTAENGMPEFTLADGTRQSDGTIDGNTTVQYSPSDAGFSFQLVSMWSIMKQFFLPKTDSNAADTSYKFKTPELLSHPPLSLENVHYSTDTKWNNKWYQKPKGWIQAMIPEGYTVKGVEYISLMLKNAANQGKDVNLGNTISTLSNTMKPLGLWTTYEKNFLFGYMFDMMSGLMGSYVASQMPGALNTAAISNLSQYLSIDGSSLVQLTTNGNGSIVANGSTLDLSKRFVLSDSSSLTSANDAAKERITNASLFGDISKTDSDAANVGGKFINAIKLGQSFLGSKIAQTIIKIFGGDKMVNGITKLDTDIESYLQLAANKVNGNKDTATVDNCVVTYQLSDVTIDGKLADGDLLDDFTIVPTTNSQALDLNLGSNLSITGDKGLVTVSFKTNGPVDYTIRPTVNNTNLAFGLQIRASDNLQNAPNALINLAATPNSSTLTDGVLAQINKTAYDVLNGNVPSNPVTIPGLPKFKNLTALNVFKNGNVKVLAVDDFDKQLDQFVADNSSLLWGATTVNGVLPAFVANETAAKLFGLKTSNLVVNKIQGAKFGYEGIGLGVFFLTVGLFVGCILHSFIFDRAKRLTKAKWSNWYFSKYMLLLTVAFFQVTAEVWVVYAAGWHAIGASAMCYVWLWLLASDFMFTTIVQALWFSLKDEIIGKFLCVIVLVTSIAAGGGEFPAFSEFGFFNGISYIVPFTYVIRGFDEIAFGISLNGTHGWSTIYMFQQWGITLIYVVIFLAFGMLVGGQLRMKEMNYGSHYGFAVAGAMRALGRDTNEFQVLRRVTRKGKKRYYYNWKSLKKGFDPELFFQCRRMYKFAGEFKWWQRKKHDFVQKPNYSDEEIISRNE